MVRRPVLCRAFVGRREELEYLRERRLEAGKSHGGFVLVAGEAGVGKSRLLSEFHGTLVNSKWRLGTGACLEFGSRPYGPILDVLARLTSPPFELGAVASKVEQFDAIVACVTGLAERAAFALVIEDIHWADAASLEVLAYLGAKLAKLRVLVIATYRTGELPSAHPTVAALERVMRSARAGRIDLVPLAGDELKTFIDEALNGIALPEPTRSAIAAVGDGNPFFTEELLKSAVETQQSPGLTRSSKLPPSIGRTLLERLRPFDDEERRVVTQAAFIGRRFSISLLAETLEMEVEAVVPTLRRARDLQLIEELSPVSFRFRHGLTREAIYGDLLGAEARPRHRAIALALEKKPAEEGSLEALAYHWWAAGDEAQTRTWNEAAGDAAASFHAHEDALVFYARALEGSDLPALALGSLREKVSDRQLALGLHSAALVTIEHAAQTFRAIGAYEREASARTVSAQIRYMLKIEDATSDLETMLERLAADEYLAAARASTGVAWIAASEWEPERATRFLDRVDPRALAERIDIRLRYHNVAAWVASTVADLDTFHDHQRRWVAAARELGTPRLVSAALSNGALCFAFLGDLERAASLIEEALTFCREARLLQGEHNARIDAVMIHLFRGDLARAREHMLARGMASESKIMTMTTWGSIVAMLLDDRDLIAELVESRAAGELDAPDFDAASAFAEYFVRNGRPRDAETLLDRATTAGIVIRGSFYTFLAMGKYGSAAACARARAWLASAAEGVSPSPERYALALFDARIRHREGHVEQAVALARDAADGFRALRFPLLEAEALESAGALAEAHDLYRRCGAAYDARRLETGEHAAPSMTSAGGVTLSTREREITRLAAGGRTNVEIASALFISQKTVEKHLASAYAKLGISSRRELRDLEPAMRAEKPVDRR